MNCQARPTAATPGIRVCAYCGQPKPENRDYFYQYPSGKWRPYCRVCWRLYQHEYRTTPQHRAWQYDYVRRPERRAAVLAGGRRRTAAKVAYNRAYNQSPRGKLERHRRKLRHRLGAATSPTVIATLTAEIAALTTEIARLKRQQEDI